MENSTKLPPTPENCHFLVHEISHNLEIGDIETAKLNLKVLDGLLHDQVANQL